MNNFLINDTDKYNSLYYFQTIDVEIVYIHYSALFIS